MKSITTLVLALGLSASAFAGDTTAAPATTAPMTTESPLLTWFVGGSVGYLFDNEEEFYTLHLGKTIASSGPISHSLFLEVGFAEFNKGGFGNIDSDVIPVTFNYMFDYAFTDAFSFYAGAGVGAAFIDSSFGPFDDSTTELSAQIFAGVAYDVTDNFELYSGLRWIWIDDSTLAGLPVDLGDDFGIELGARFRF